MNLKSTIFNSNNNLLTEVTYNKNYSQYNKITKFKKTLENNLEIKNNCILNDNILVLQKDTNIVYINYIYMINNNIIFSNYEIISDQFNNHDDKYLLILINIKKNISIIDINKMYHKKIYTNLYYQDKCDYIDNFINSKKNLKDILSNCFVASYLVNINGYLLKYLSHDLKNNKEIILLAVKNSEQSLQYASDELRNNKELLLKVIEKNENNLQDESKFNLTEDGLSNMIQLKKDLQYKSNELIIHKDIVLKAINKTNGYAINFLSEKFLTNKEVVLKAVNLNGNTIKYLSKEFQADKDIALIAIKKFGHALRYVSKELQADKELVLIAVQRNGNALQYASRELQADNEVVLTAIEKNGNAILHVSKELLSNKDFILTAIKKNSYIINYLSKDLFFDNEVILTTFLSEIKQNVDKLKKKQLEFKDVFYNSYYNSLEINSLLITNKQIFLEILKLDTSVLQYISHELRNELKKDKALLENIFNKVRLKELKQDCNLIIETIPSLDDEMNLFYL